MVSAVVRSCCHPGCDEAVAVLYNHQGPIFCPTHAPTCEDCGRILQRTVSIEGVCWQCCERSELYALRHRLAEIAEVVSPQKPLTPLETVNVIYGRLARALDEIEGMRLQG